MIIRFYILLINIKRYFVGLISILINSKISDGGK